MLNDGRFPAWAASVNLLSVASLAACLVLTPVGVRADGAEHPKTAGYPVVGDIPPKPEKPAMTADEQSKLKQELTAARDHQPKSK
jgi:hypothetical protein